jgi:hypothetical protein
LEGDGSGGCAGWRRWRGCLNSSATSLIKAKRVFEILPDSPLERYLVNGCENILPLLVERILEIETAGARSELNPIQPKVLIIDEINRLETRAVA